MGKFIDLTGQRFGRLIVIERVKSKNPNARWLCKCDCGNHKEVDAHALKSGNIKSCGCLAVNDLTGKRFGRLVVIKDSGERRKFKNRSGGSIIWECLCDCGNTTLVRSDVLVSGGTKSCGCINTERENLTDKHFGRLTVLGLSKEKSNDVEDFWECLCECGNVVNIRTRVLKAGQAISCGCYGKEKMKKYQDENHMEGTSLYLIKPTNKKRKNNTSGITGIYWYERYQKWMAKIGFQGKNIYLGMFSDINDAIAARKAAEEKYFKPVLEKYAESRERGKE